MEETKDKQVIDNLKRLQQIEKISNDESAPSTAEMAKALINRLKQPKDEGIDYSPLYALASPNVRQGLMQAASLKQAKRASESDRLLQALKFKASLDKAQGGLALKELSQSTIKNLEEGNFLPTILNDTDRIILDNEDMYGPVVGRLSSWNPKNVKAQSIDAAMRAASQAFGRYMEGGVLRKEDEEKYRKMFPKLSDEPGTAKNKLAVVKRLLAQKQVSAINTYGMQGYDMTGLDKGLSIPDLPSGIVKDGRIKVINKSTGEKYDIEEGDLEAALNEGFEIQY